MQGRGGGWKREGGKGGGGQKCFNNNFFEDNNFAKKCLFNQKKLPNFKFQQGLSLHLKTTGLAMLQTTPDTAGMCSGMKVGGGGGATEGGEDTGPVRTHP